ncbi:hypothetical protein NIE88_19025 [Sporolactobacillus shoreicorticis]|uniref:Uncharacterized protein n=1 Tax=Sporolactobacillus shoreicorticis TaxID=1923877 RepID=A0ABW5S8L8_9BACL|nr:hypothetical protein [Sporolactobacillus shoreicorticis]MCO7127844.1 hypothetical protein [Sporolactobacillus shoreicorticis]
MKSTQFGKWKIEVSSEKALFVQEEKRLILLNSDKYYMFLAELDKEDNITIQNIDSDIELNILYSSKTIKIAFKED